MSTLSNPTHTAIAFDIFTATDSRGYVWATGQRSEAEAVIGAKYRMKIEGVRGIKAALADLTFTSRPNA
jgi:hypothetical protein